MIKDYLKKIFSGSNFPMIFLYLLIGYMFISNELDKKLFKDDMVKFTNAIEDTVKVKIDKYGDKVYQISQIKAPSTKVLMNVKSKDASIVRLQEEVKKYDGQLGESGSVTVFNSGVKIDTTLVVKYNNDSIESSATDGKWFSVKNVINGSKSTTSIAVNNEYSIAIVEEKGQSVVKVKNKNPYSTEGEIRSYSNLPKDESKFSLGIGLGYSPFDGTIKPELQFQYKLLKLW